MSVYHNRTSLQDRLFWLGYYRPSPHCLKKDDARPWWPQRYAARHVNGNCTAMLTFSS